jgi:hypothetical protein
MDAAQSGKAATRSRSIPPGSGLDEVVGTIVGLALEKSR